MNEHLPMYCSPRPITRPLSREEKETRYTMAYEHLLLVLQGESDPIARMATIACILNGLMETFYWVGFYRVDGDMLVVGPYQGTMGCLRIPKGKGVCGRCRELGEPILVPNVHDFPGHIACDSSSRSEVVLPIFDAQNKLIAVFDIDSDIEGALDETDLKHLLPIADLVARALKE